MNEEKESDLLIKLIESFQRFVIGSIENWNIKYKTSFYCPSEDETEKAFIEGYRAMTKYGLEYGINTIGKVDLIKLFAFASLHFDIDFMENTNSKIFSTQPLWYGILARIPIIHEGCQFSLSNLKDGVKTCGILHYISYKRINPNNLAAYCYMKGAEEVAIATIVDQKT